MLIRETITEHLGTAVHRLAHVPECRRENASSQSFLINVIYTDPEATGVALRAAESLANSLGSTICLQALVCVPYHISLATPTTSISHISRVLAGVVERFGSTACTHILQIHVCRSRIETLLRNLQPSSLVVIGGRRRLWPTWESRMLKAVRAEGHSVVFVDHKTGRSDARWS